MIPILPPHAWREFRAPAPNQGSNKTTHLALVEAPDGKLHKCFVKMVPNGWPSVLTEALAWLLAEALDLPRPEFAAIVPVPVPELRRLMPLDQHWVGYGGLWPAFAASAVEGKALAQRWRWLYMLQSRSALSHNDVQRVAAFDEWVDNRDRNLGNVLRTSSGRFVPIDNEFAFFQPIWTAIAPGFGVGHNSLLLEAERRLTSDGFKQFKVKTAVSSDAHIDAYSRAKPALMQTIAALAPGPAGTQLAAAVDHFLSPRAPKTWMCQHLQVIA